MALGKGLSALIPDKNPNLEQSVTQAQDTQREIVSDLEIALIKDSCVQPRLNYDEEKLNELMLSIKEKGFLQPIVVRKTGQEYEVIAGERRLKAARKLRLNKIPVVIKEATDREALILALVENIQREELNAIEKAESYRRLIDEFGHTQEDVAKSVGKDRVTVANLLRLLRLPEEIRKAISEGKISEGHARALVSVEDLNSQKVLFLEILHKGLSVREVEDRAKKTASDKLGKKKAKVLKDPEIARVEEELRKVFGTKVLVDNKRGNKGKIVIEYYSLDDFDRILTAVRQ